MKQTGYFNNSVLINMRITCFTKYINEKQLKEFNKIYDIKFNVIKYNEENNQFDDNTHWKNNYFRSDKTNNKYIKLSLIENIIF